MAGLVPQTPTLSPSREARGALTAAFDAHQLCAHHRPMGTFQGRRAPLKVTGFEGEGRSVLAALIPSFIAGPSCPVVVVSLSFRQVDEQEREKTAEEQGIQQGVPLSPHSVCL